MEQLKSCIPEDLRTLILSTPTPDLITSCAALLHHFSTGGQFSQLLEQLVNPDLTSCAKDAVGAVNWKRDGNAAFDIRDYGRALSCYTKALRHTPFASNEDDDRVSQATLFINRATTLHKLGRLKSAMRDCDRAVDLHPAYSKAWYRRGHVKCDLSDFAGAVRDLERALASETTSPGQLRIKRELAQINLMSRSANCSGLTQTCMPSPDSGSSSSKWTALQKRRGRGALQKHWTKEAGWNLQTKEDLPSGSLVFQEDPYAAVVLKSSRDTHCHFCFESLPPDPVPCNGCAIPLYCSEVCRSRAGGINTKVKHGNSKQIDLGSVPGIPLANSTCELNNIQEDLESSHQRWGEHVAECGGASWSAVLPTEAVLSARMLYCTTYMDNGVLMRKFNLVKATGDLSEVDTLCHHYDHFSPRDKLELHVLAIVIAHCVKQSAVPLLETSITIAAKLIGLMAQARVNAMAIFGMSSPDFDDDMGNSSYSSTPQNAVSSLCAVEQVKVAQGIYLIGSRLNHSCIPNVHASFVLGRLFIHTVTNITQDSTLELCYGPQAGRLNQLERKQQLLKSYFFNCTCPACSKLTLPDLFLRSFRCAKPGCMGVVLGPKSLESKFDGTNYRECINEAKQENIGGRGHLVPKDKDSQHLTPCSSAAIDIDLTLMQEFVKASFLQKANTGCCLCCGMVVDIKMAREVATNATSHLERVESNVVKADTDGKNLKGALKGAVKALNSLRVTVHAYNEQLAKGEDIVARLFCALDQPLRALEHCLRSIEILEHLYHKKHIVVGNEHLKLASVALMVPDIQRARGSLEVVDQIFSVHYGTDYRSRFPYVIRLQQMAMEILGQKGFNGHY